MEEESTEGKKWGIWPTRQTLIDQELLQRRGKVRSGITTTPKAARFAKVRKRSKAASKARRVNR